MMGSNEVSGELLVQLEAELMYCLSVLGCFYTCSLFALP